MLEPADRGADGGIDNGFEYEDMFRWLKTGLAGLTTDECDLLENYVLKWEICMDRSWLQGGGLDGKSRRIWRPLERAPAVQRLAEMNRLRRQVAGPAAPSGGGHPKQGKTARDKVECPLQTLWSSWSCRKRSGRSRCTHQAADGRTAGGGGDGAAVGDSLRRAGSVCGNSGGGAAGAARNLPGFFRQVLTQYSVGTIPVALDQVSVSEITRNDRHTAEYLFLLGANDHVLPDPGQSGGILNEDDREELALQGIQLAPTGHGADGRSSCKTSTPPWPSPPAGLTVSYPA